MVPFLSDDDDNEGEEEEEEEEEEDDIPRHPRSSKKSREADEREDIDHAIALSLVDARKFEEERGWEGEVEEDAGKSMGGGGGAVTVRQSLLLP